MNLALEKPIIFFDIESTGPNVVNDRIVELAVMKIHPDKMRESRVYRLNPEMPISQEAIEIHGITNEDVADCPTFGDKAEEISDFFGSSDLAGYNSNRFDVPMLVEEFLRADMVFDTKNRRLVDVFRIFTKKEKRDLSAAYQFYCSKDLQNAHNAEADVTATFEVLMAQLELYDDLEGDVSFLEEYSKDGDFLDLGRRMIIKNGEVLFNFGKHKGKRVIDVLQREPQYYNWIMKNDFLLDTKQKLKEIKLTLK
jgi:DNA polymerase-3 subunit epsilon